MPDKTQTTTLSGSRVKELRKARGLTQVELGQKIGVTGAAVAQWERGGNIALKHLPLLAKVLRTTTDELIGVPQITSQGTHNSVTPIDISRGEIVPLVALRGLTVQNMGARRKEAESTGSVVISSNTDSDSALAFLVIDRSMEPDYKIGETVIIDRLLIEPGDHIVVHIKSQKITIFREFAFEGSDYRKLIPLNPQYQILRFTDEEWKNDVEVIGVMVTHIRKRRSGHTA